MEYAIIETGGKQYKVGVGDVIAIERINGTNSSVSFNKVLLLVSDAGARIGKPYLDDVSVLGNFLGEVKGEKIKIARFKAKSRYRKVRGHRQLLSRVEIQKILKSPDREKK